MPKPIKRKDGNFVDSKNRIFLTKFYSGKQFDGSTHELIDLAKNIALLHKILVKYTGTYNYRTNQKFYKILSKYDLQRIKNLILSKKKKKSFDLKVLKNFEFIQKCISEDKIILKKIKNMKKQLIHSDLHPGNVIFHNNKVVAIIDFNSLKKGNLFEDLAFSTFRFGSYGLKDSEKIKKRIELFLEIYRKYNSFDNKQLFEIGLFFRHMTLYRLCYILRKYYFKNSHLWLRDFDKHLNYLKLEKKIKLFKKSD